MCKGTLHVVCCPRSRSVVSAGSLPGRDQLLPHKRGTSFGHWGSYLQIPPRLGPLHRLKGMVSEAAVHVPVVMCGRFR
jgi:hypothetical protein